MNFKGKRVYSVTWSDRAWRFQHKEPTCLLLLESPSIHIYALFLQCIVAIISFRIAKPILLGKLSENEEACCKKPVIYRSRGLTDFNICEVKTSKE